jgi:hypothetical protein
MQHTEKTNLHTQMVRIGGDLEQCGGTGFEQKTKENPLADQTRIPDSEQCRFKLFLTTKIVESGDRMGRAKRRGVEVWLNDSVVGRRVEWNTRVIACEAVR